MGPFVIGVGRPYQEKQWSIRGHAGPNRTRRLRRVRVEEEGGVKSGYQGGGALGVASRLGSLGRYSETEQ